MGSHVRLVPLEVEYSSLPTLTDVIALPSLPPSLIEQRVHVREITRRNRKRHVFNGPELLEFFC